MSTLILIDAKNALYRFGYANATLSSRGRSTGALYGILGAIVRLKRRYPDGQMVMVWDGPGRSWRHRVFPEYKSNRGRSRVITAAAESVVRAKQRRAEEEKERMRGQLMGQIPMIKDLTGRIGIPSLEVPCVEADDLIGMAAVMHRAFGFPVVVYSSDKDFCQLMSIGVQIIRPQPFARDRKDVLAVETEESILKDFGCLPAEVLAVRAYAGDTSDTIPVAIPNIGIKRALECVRAGADPSKDELKCADMKIMKKVRGGWAAVRRNYTLMQIAAAPDEKLFGAEVAQAAKKCLLAGSTAILQWDRLRKDRDQENTVRSLYRNFVFALVDLDLEYALEDRHLLWNCQLISA